MLNMIAQIMITYHNDRAGKPLVEHTCHNEGSINPSNKIMVFLPGLARIHQFFGIMQRALDFGWTWGLIPLPFRCQSSEECIAKTDPPRRIQSDCGKQLDQAKTSFV